MNIADILASLVVPQYPQLKRMWRDDEQQTRQLKAEDEYKAANERSGILASYPSANIQEINPNTGGWSDVPINQSVSYKDAIYDQLGKSGKLDEALLAQLPKQQDEKDLWQIAKWGSDIKKAGMEQQDWLSQREFDNTASAISSIENPQTNLMKPERELYGGQMQDELQRFGADKAQKWLGDRTAKLPNDVQEYKYAVGQGYRGTFDKWQKEGKAAGAAKTTVTVNTGGKEFWKGIGEGAAKSFEQSRDGANSAARGIETVHTGRQLLDSGIITGTAANWRLGFGKALATAGLADPNKNGVANTEAYQANMGKQVGEIIKLFGAGTGLSDADREYAEKIVGGKIETTEASLRKILDINEKAARNVLKKHNAQAAKIQGNPNATEIPFDFAVPEPPAYQSPKKAASQEPQKQGSKADFINAARKANPGMSLKEISDIYDKKYGGK